MTRMYSIFCTNVLSKTIKTGPYVYLEINDSGTQEKLFGGTSCTIAEGCSYKISGGDKGVLTELKGFIVNGVFYEPSEVVSGVADKDLYVSIIPCVTYNRAALTISSKLTNFYGINGRKSSEERFSELTRGHVYEYDVPYGVFEFKYINTKRCSILVNGLLNPDSVPVESLLQAYIVNDGTFSNQRSYISFVAAYSKTMFEDFGDSGENVLNQISGSFSFKITKNDSSQTVEGGSVKVISNKEVNKGESLPLEIEVLPNSFGLAYEVTGFSVINLLNGEKVTYDVLKEGDRILSNFSIPLDSSYVVFPVVKDLPYAYTDNSSIQKISHGSGSLKDGIYQSFKTPTTAAYGVETNKLISASVDGEKSEVSEFGENPTYYGVSTLVSKPRTFVEAFSRGGQDFLMTRAYELSQDGNLTVPPSLGMSIYEIGVDSDTLLIQRSTETALATIAIQNGKTYRVEPFTPNGVNSFEFSHFRIYDENLSNFYNAEGNSLEVPYCSIKSVYAMYKRCAMYSFSVESSQNGSLTYTASTPQNETDGKYREGTSFTVSVLPDKYCIFEKAEVFVGSGVTPVKEVHPNDLSDGVFTIETRGVYAGDVRIVPFFKKRDFYSFSKKISNGNPDGGTFNSLLKSGEIYSDGKILRGSVLTCTPVPKDDFNAFEKVDVFTNGDTVNPSKTIYPSDLVEGSFDWTLNSDVEMVCYFYEKPTTKLMLIERDPFLCSVDVFHNGIKVKLYEPFVREGSLRILVKAKNGTRVKTLFVRNQDGVKYILDPDNPVFNILENSEKLSVCVEMEKILHKLKIKKGDGVSFSRALYTDPAGVQTEISESQIDTPVMWEGGTLSLFYGQNSSGCSLPYFTPKTSDYEFFSSTGEPIHPEVLSDGTLVFRNVTNDIDVFERLFVKLSVISNNNSLGSVVYSGSNEIPVGSTVHLTGDSDAGTVMNSKFLAWFLLPTRENVSFSQETDVKVIYVDFQGPEYVIMGAFVEAAEFLKGKLSVSIDQDLTDLYLFAQGKRVRPITKDDWDKWESENIDRIPAYPEHKNVFFTVPETGRVQISCIIGDKNLLNFSEWRVSERVGKEWGKERVLSSEEIDSFYMTSDVRITAVVRLSDIIFCFSKDGKNKRLNWRSKRYVSSVPYHPTCAKIDGIKKEVLLTVDTFSSPTSPKKVGRSQTKVKSVRGVRLPFMRNDRYIEVEVSSEDQVGNVYVGTSMTGMNGGL